MDIWDVTSTTETAAAGFEASNGEHEPTAEATDSVPVQTDHDGDHHDGGEQRRRGPPGNKPAGWRPLPRTPSTRRPFRPRQDHGGPPPAWKQFEGVALHVRPAAAHAPHAAAAHKRHVVLPTSTAFTPLHVFPAGAAGWQQLQQRTHFPAVGAPLWGMHVQAPPPQHVWSPAGPQGGSWGAQQVRMQQVAYGTPMGAPLPCHLCPPMGPTGQMAARMAPPLLHLAVGAAGPSPPAQRPRSPVAGPAWTC